MQAAEHGGIFTACTTTQQTQLRKTPGWDLNTQPSCFKTSVLTAVPLSSLDFIQCRKEIHVRKGIVFNKITSTTLIGTPVVVVVVLLMFHIYYRKSDL